MDAFVAIEKCELKRKLDKKEACILEIPAKMTRGDAAIDEKIKAVTVGDKLAPYLCCADCNALMIW